MKNRKTREKTSSKKSFLKKVIGVTAVTMVGITVYSVGSVLGILPSLKQGDAKASEERFHIEFNREKEVYSQNEIEEDFKNLNFVYGQDRMAIKYGALCIDMPKGKTGIEDSGAQINFDLNASNEYTIEYDVYYDGNNGSFDWSNEGSLCGISGGDYDSRENADKNNDGYCVSLKWSDKGVISPYIYNKDGEMQNDEQAGILTDNSWHKIKMYVKLNTLGKEDGVVKVWLDGVLGYAKEDIELTKLSSSLDTATILAYHNDAPSKEQYVYIDNYRAYPEDRDINYFEKDSDSVSGNALECVSGDAKENKLLSISSSLSTGKSGNCSVNVFVNNNSEETIEGWSMRIKRSSVNIVSIWGAELEEKDDYYIITPTSWNEVITSSSRVGFGFEGDEDFDGMFEYEVF